MSCYIDVYEDSPGCEDRPPQRYEYFGRAILCDVVEVHTCKKIA